MNFINLVALVALVIGYSVMVIGGAAGIIIAWTLAIEAILPWLRERERRKKEANGNPPTEVRK